MGIQLFPIPLKSHFNNLHVGNNLGSNFVHFPTKCGMIEWNYLWIGESLSSYASILLISLWPSANHIMKCFLFWNEHMSLCRVVWILGRLKYVKVIGAFISMWFWMCLDGRMQEPLLQPLWVLQGKMASSCTSDPFCLSVLTHFTFKVKII